MSFFIKDKLLEKDNIIFWHESSILLKNDMRVNQCTMEKFKN